MDMTSLKNTISEWILSQREVFIRDLCDLIHVESISDPEDRRTPFGEGCQEALALMLQKGRDLGLVSADYDHVCGSLSLDGGERLDPEKYTGIWCHLDVVPPGEGWQTPPFQAVYHDGLVTGRGSQDNKGPAVVGLYILKFLKEKKIHLDQPVALYLGLSEECGMQDLDRFLEKYKAPGLSLIADCGFPVCYGEKGDMTVRITARHRTQMQIRSIDAGVAHNIIPGNASADLVINGQLHRIRAEGKAGHSAFPQGAENAITALLKQMLLLAEDSTEEGLLKLFCRLAEETDGRSPGIAFSDEVLGDLTCCAVGFSVKDGCWQMDLDIRYPASVSPDTIQENILRAAERYDCTAEILGNLPAFGYSPEDPLILELTEIYNREAGEATSPYAMAGGTYAAKLPDAIPFGLSFPDKSAIQEHYPKGHGDYHQPDESVSVDQLLKALEIYLIALLETDGHRVLSGESTKKL